MYQNDLSRLSSEFPEEGGVILHLCICRITSGGVTLHLCICRITSGGVTLHLCICRITSILHV